MLKSLKADLKVLSYIYKITYSLSPSYNFIVVVLAIINAMAPFLMIVIPKFIIDELVGAQDEMTLILLVCTLAGGNFILNAMSRFLEHIVKVKNEAILQAFDRRMGQNVMDMSFEKLEDPHVLDLKERAIYPIKNQGAIYNILTGSVTLIQQLIFCIAALWLVGTLHFMIPLFILVMIAFNSFLYKKLQKTMYEFFQILIPINRKFGYYMELTSNFTFAKDIRLYNLSPLLLKRIQTYNIENIRIFKQLNVRAGQFGALNVVLTQLQCGVIYAYMVFQVIGSRLGIGDFTMYISATTQFSTSVTLIVNTYIDIMQRCRYLEHLLEFEEVIVSPRLNVTNDVPSVIESIEFKNVSFKYPRNDQYVLKNINLRILKGEHLSLVGLNGAGKTTLIKLLSRLYVPTEGEILLNGVNIQTFDEVTYQKFLGVVFQDFKTLAFSVKENISFEQSETSDEAVMAILSQVGLDEDVMKLPKGVHTSLYKSFEEDGVEFSGGMAQKMAISRAIFKDAPIVILDEPTAALDPIAEAEIFSLFHQLVKEKTTIYISHRLSSCKLSDYIVVFEAGQIVEQGTHEALVLNQSLYAKMFEAQATYYANVS